MTSASIASTAPAARRIVLADLLPGERTRDVLLVLAAAAFVGASAQFSVPVPGSPVPVTGQTFAVLLSGAALGWQRGGAALLLYAAAGSAGVPWFSDGASGLGGPTFGYIIGFIFSAAIVGALAGRGGDRTVMRTIGSMLVGTAIVYMFGVPWLMASTGMDLQAAVAAGLTPFLMGSLVKILLAAGLLPTAWRFVGR